MSGTASACPTLTAKTKRNDIKISDNFFIAFFSVL
jgi:hypothetical protein